MKRMMNASHVEKDVSNVRAQPTVKFVLGIQSIIWMVLVHARMVIIWCETLEFYSVRIALRNVLLARMMMRIAWSANHHLSMMIYYSNASALKEPLKRHKLDARIV